MPSSTRPRPRRPSRPGRDLAEIRSAREVAHTSGRALPVVVSLTGTDADPQGYASTADILAAAGASVFLSNAAATRHAAMLLSGPAHGGAR